MPQELSKALRSKGTGFTGCGKLNRAVGRGFIPGNGPIESTRALQAAEKGMFSDKMAEEHPAGAKQAAEKPSIPAWFSLGADFLTLWPVFAAVSSLRFASGRRFIGFQTHFGPIEPAIQSESVSSCASSFAP
jgi:hypothetical protein